jgi:hypothetical protein
MNLADGVCGCSGRLEDSEGRGQRDQESARQKREDERCLSPHRFS